MPGHHTNILAISASMPGHHWNSLHPRFTRVTTMHLFESRLSTWMWHNASAHNSHPSGTESSVSWLPLPDKPKDTLLPYSQDGSPHGAPGEFTCFFLTDQGVNLRGPPAVSCVSDVHPVWPNHCSNPELSPYFPRWTAMLPVDLEWE